MRNELDNARSLKEELSIRNSDLDRRISLIHSLNNTEEFVLNREGIIISSNLESVNVTGYEEYEILGKHISILFKDRDKQRVNSDLATAVELGIHVLSDICKKKRAVEFWAKIEIRSLVSSDPNRPCFRLILQDATHRAISDVRIETLKKEHLTVFTNPFIGTFKFHMDGYQLNSYNTKTVETIGFSESHSITFRDFFASMDQFDQFICLLKDEKKVEGFKFLIPSKIEGEDNWAVISAQYFEGQGMAEGILLDVSEQHHQTVELKRVNGELDNFTYHASHDLRSPLTTMMGLVNLGLKESTIEGAHGLFNMLQDRITHMDSLLKDLISVSYNNMKEIEPEPFDFTHEIDLILKSLGYAQMRFKVKIQIQQNVVFKTDRVRMITILRNLLSNSFKYENPEAESAWIHLKIQVDLSHATFQLMDNGIGIERAYKEKIYDMFFRATDRSSGSGLGLYIVKSMIEKLKGRISVESTVNVGTTFLFTIPNHASGISSTAFENYKREKVSMLNY